MNSKCTVYFPSYKIHKEYAKNIQGSISYVLFISYNVKFFMNLTYLLKGELLH